MALTGSFKNTVQLNNSLAGVDLTTPNESLNEVVQKTIAAGVLYHDTKALTASQVYELDVNDGSLVDVFGNTIEMAVVTGIYILAATANTGTIQITDGVTALLGDMPALAAGEALSFLTDMVSTTNVKLYITDSGDADSFTIIITGTEA